jgi:pyruvate formate lyase activating enzyme
VTSRDDNPTTSSARLVSVDALRPRAPRPAGETLEDELARRTAKAVLVEPGPGSSLRCVACAHRCVVAEGRAGACGVRFNRGGELRVPYGYVARRYVRSVETNTIYHVRPGARSLAFGMFGCDLRCPYCHNWHISQAIREGGSAESPSDVTPEALVDEAVRAGCEVVCAAYNEPMIAAEWVHAVFSEAKRRGLVTALISDGNTTPEALAYVRPVADVYRVDLKGYDNDQYRTLGGRVEPVLEAIREAKRQGFWVEVVTLVVPGFNDQPDGLRMLAKHIAAIDPAIPWHLNAFHPRYKLKDRPPGHPLTLLTAAGTAYAKGLQFVYVSNLPDEVRELSHTRCPRCTRVLVQRANYATLSVELHDGACPDCGTSLPGLWGEGARVPAAAELVHDEMP